MPNRTEQQLDKILRMPGSSRVPEQSMLPVKSTAHLEQIRVLMKQAACAYPAQELTPETVTVWLPIWIEMAEKHGMRALAEAVKQHMRTSRFFPLPADLHDLLTQQVQERRQEKQASRVDRPMTQAERIKRFGARHPFAQPADDTVESVRAGYGEQAAWQYAEQIANEQCEAHRDQKLA